MAVMNRRMDYMPVTVLAVPLEKSNLYFLTVSVVIIMLVAVCNTLSPDSGLRASTDYN